MKAIKWHDFFKIEPNKMFVYKITPHRSVTNNTNRKLWKAIHKIYEIYDSKQSRLKRNGLKFTFREKDTVWYDIIFRMKDGKKQVEFYISTSEVWSKKLKNMLENRMKVTIEDAAIEDLQIPENDTMIHDLRLLKHDLYSLDTDARTQTTPIAPILSTLDDIEEGDMVRLSVNAETMSRESWSKISEYASDKLKKGKCIDRSRLSPQKAGKAVFKGVATLFNEIVGVINDTMQAFENVFMKPSEKKFNDKKPEIIIKDHGAPQVFNHNKLNQDVWKTRIRVATHSKSESKRDMIASTITGAFSEIGGDNELNGIKITFKGRRQEIIKELNTLRLSKRTITDGDTNILSCDEMAKIALQMPTSEVQDRYEDELTANRKVETEIPEIFQNGGIEIGSSEVRGENLPIYIPIDNPDELFRTYVFQGSQGMGKDTTIKKFVIDACMKHGIGSIIPDAIMESGERGMADGIRDALPAEKIIDIDLSDADYPVPMDLTEVIQKLGRNGVNRFAQEIIDFFGDMEGMARSRSILREAAKASDGSLYNIKCLLENEEYRNKRIEELRGFGQERLAETIESWGDNKKLGAKGDAILYRLDELFGDDHLFNIFAQPPKKELNFEQWMEEGKVVILRIPNRKLGTLATKTLIHWIVLKTFMTRLLSDKGKGTFIVFNEPHQYMTDGLQNLLQRIVLEGRKWRIGALFAFHHIGLLPKTFADDLQASGTNWFLFANTHKGVYERLKEELDPTFEIESAMNTEKWHAICLLQFGGRRQHPFLVKMAKSETQYDNSFLTKKHSRLYGRHWSEVENYISCHAKSS